MEALTDILPSNVGEFRGLTITLRNGDKEKILARKEGTILYLEEGMVRDSVTKLKRAIGSDHHLTPILNNLFTRSGPIRISNIPNDADSVNITLSTVKPIMVSIDDDPKLALTQLLPYSRVGLSALSQAGGVDKSGMISFYLACMCAVSKTLHQALYRWAILNNCDFLVIEAGQCDVSDSDLLKHFWFAMVMGFKTVQETYFPEWATNRLNVLASSLGISKWEALPSAGAVDYSDFIRSNRAILEIILNYIEACRHSENVNSAVKSVTEAVDLVAQYSGMTTLMTTYNYLQNNTTAILLLEQVYKEIRHFDEQYQLLQQEAGEKFPYARILDIGCISTLNVSHYKNLAWVAWYDRKQKENTYAKVAEPQPTISKNVLAQHHAIQISNTRSFDSADDHRQWLKQRLGMDDEEEQKFTDLVEAARKALEGTRILSSNVNVTL